MHLDTDLLATLVAIADTGSFTRAAERVNRTQSAVSMQMKRLEEIIGRTLFERDGRAVRMSHEGHVLLNYARRMVQMESEVLNTLRQPDMVGRVRLGVPDDFAMRYLPGILTAFYRAHPLIQVEVRCQPSRELLPLTANELDLAIVVAEPGHEPGELLCREQLVWVAAPNHCLMNHDPLPLAVFDDGCACSVWAAAALEASGRNHRIAFTSASISGILAAVRAGLAITAFIRTIVPPDLHIIGSESDMPTLPSTSIVLQRKRGLGNRPIDCLADYIIEGFRADGSEPRPRRDEQEAALSLA